MVRRENEYLKIIEDVPIGLYEFDIAAGRFTYVNKRHVRIYGLHPKRIIAYKPFGSFDGTKQVALYGKGIQIVGEWNLFSKSFL